MQMYWWLLAGLLLAGCAMPPPSLTTPAASTPSPSSAATATPGQPFEAPSVVPSVDTTQYSVSLDEVYFDTFRAVNRAVPLSEAPPELIRRLRDAIPPIHNPKYQNVIKLRLRESPITDSVNQTSLKLAQNAIN